MPNWGIKVPNRVDSYVISYRDFLHRSVLLTGRLLNQGFIETRLKSILKKFFGRCHHLTLPCRVSVATVASGICGPWYCCREYVFIPWCGVGGIVAGAACGAGGAYPSGAPDFTSGFHRGSCCPAICVSLFHVI